MILDLGNSRSKTREVKGIFKMPAKETPKKMDGLRNSQP